MAKPYEPPFKSKEILIYLKKHGGPHATIAYLEYLCIQCCPTKGKLLEYSAEFKRNNENKSTYVNAASVIQSTPAIHEI